MNNRKALKKWREDRNINKFNYKVYFENIIEELLEPMYAGDALEAVKHKIMNNVSFEVQMSTIDILDALTDIRVFSENETENMGYNSTKCMKEVIKEICSRKQDPIQKMSWEKWGNDGSKWQKDKEQPIEDMHKADFIRCELRKC